MWHRIAAAAEAARRRGAPRRCSSGRCRRCCATASSYFDMGEGTVDAFEDVRFPIALGREASVEPAFSTAVVTDARAAPSSATRLGRRAAALRRRAGGARRGGSARADRLLPRAARRGGRVPLRGPVRPQLERHDRRAGAGGPAARDGRRGADRVRAGQDLWRPGAADHPAGGGNGAGVGRRRRAGRAAGRWRRSGVVEFDEAPAAGAEVRAGFRFDVPVRFAEDRLSRQPRHLRGGRDPVGAADRGAGGS